MEQMSAIVISRWESVRGDCPIFLAALAVSDCYTDKNSLATKSDEKHSIASVTINR